MRYLLIKNNIVVNAIEADSEFISNLSGYDHKILTDNYGIGFSYINGVFSEPELQPVGSNGISLTQLEFLRRFSAEERIAIRSSDNPIIVDFLHLLNLAQEIKTDDPDTIAGVNYLETLNLIAEGRAAEILA